MPVGDIKQPQPVKLVISMFTQYPDLFDRAQVRLAKHFGPVDFVSEMLPFEHTDYYASEFGEHLIRRFVTFQELIHPARLAEIKTLTNALEKEWSVEGKRRINLDPGYVSASKLVLATTKDHAHRIYLDQGIYAEVTLRFCRKAFHPWPWTYPDYASPSYLQLFKEIRQRYMLQLCTVRSQAAEQPPQITR